MQRCKAETTSSEFMTWMVFLRDQELHGFHRQDYHTAKICATIRSLFDKDVKEVDYLLKFKGDDPEPEKQLTDEEMEKEMEDTMMKSKMMWGIALGQFTKEMSM